MDVKSALVQCLSGNCKDNRQKQGDFTVAIGDCPGGPLDPWLEVEEADKGQGMFKVFEGKE